MNFKKNKGGFMRFGGREDGVFILWFQKLKEILFKGSYSILKSKKQKQKHLISEQQNPTAAHGLSNCHAKQLE